MKKYFFNLIIVSFCIFNQSASIAQLPDYLRPGEPLEFKQYFHSKKDFNPSLQKLESVLQVRPYDVLNYGIYLDWYGILTAPGVNGNHRIYNGINTITLKIDSNNIKQLTFDAINLLIDSVISNEDKFKLKINQTSENFQVDLLSPKFIGDTVILKVYFQYSGKDNAGLYLFPQGQYVGQGPPPKRDSVYVLERLAYTMSEPQDARKWVPCNDNPFDKANVNFKIKVPKGFNVAANGIRDSIKTVGDSVFYFNTSLYPMTTYLMTVNASKFKEETTYYKRITSGFSDTLIPVEYFIWEPDWTSDTTNGGAYNAEYSFRNVVKMMEIYSQIFGEYPFEKYGMVAVQPFGFGGMEHQTMTTINRSWMRGYSETGIAHELAHQWLGDMITCATWYDIWINEGGATWSEALWIESFLGKNGYYQYMNQIAQRYKSEEILFEIPIYGVPINSIFSYPISLLEYNKASWIYHMLREQLGDEIFFTALKNLFKKYKYQSLETINFRDTFKELIPKSNLDFDVFFEQWLTKAGHPKFKLNTSTFDWGSGKSKINIQVEQVQEGINVPNVFTTPVEFLFFKDSTVMESKTVILNSRIQSFEFFLSFYPDSVALNTRKVLCDIEENLMSIKTTDNPLFATTQIAPNPVIKGYNAQLSLNFQSESNILIQIFDSFGRLINTIVEGNIPAGDYIITIPTDKLSSGTYLIKVEKGSNNKIQKLIVVN